MAETMSGGDARRRTKKRRSGGSRGGTSPAVGPLIGWVVAIVGVAYLVIGVRLFLQDVGQYLGVPIGSNEQEALYFAGSPAGRSMQGRSPALSGTWEYQDDASVRKLLFRGGRVAQITCVNKPQQSIHACPPVLGVHIGDHETDLLDELGGPTSERVGAGSKVMRYSDLGFEFVLTGSRVSEIRMVEGGTPGGALARLPLWLLP